MRAAELDQFLRWNGTGAFRRDPNLKADVERISGIDPAGAFHVAAAALGYQIMRNFRLGILTTNKNFGSAGRTPSTGGISCAWSDALH